MIRFIHTADIHFGVENYGKVDSHTGMHSRLLDFAKAVHFMIDVAIEEEVDFFLFAGDAYKIHNPTQTQQKMLLEAFFRLHKAGIPVVIVVGNHDHPVSSGKIHALNVFAQFPLEGFHVIAKPRVIQLITKNGPIQIVGVPWPTRSILSLQETYQDACSVAELVGNTVSTIIFELANRLDMSIPAILCGHLTVSSGVFSGSERTAMVGTDPLFLPSSLTLPQFDYIALGHLHRYQQLTANPPMVYSGSPERIDFGERNDTKGFCLVSVEKNYCKHEFIHTPTRSFVQLDIVLTNDIAYTDQIIAHLEKTDIRDAIVKIVYTLPEIILFKIDMQKILCAAARAMYVAGIIPIYTQHKRTIRMQFENQQTQAISSIIESYIQSRPEYQIIKNDLLEKIAYLSQEVQIQQQKE